MHYLPVSSELGSGFSPFCNSHRIICQSFCKSGLYARFTAALKGRDWKLPLLEGYVCSSNYAGFDTIQLGTSRKQGITCLPFAHSYLEGYLISYLICVTENCFEVSAGKRLLCVNLGSWACCLRAVKRGFGLNFNLACRVDVRMYNFATADTTVIGNLTRDTL